jgi:hypothetical protein
MEFELAETGSAITLNPWLHGDGPLKLQWIGAKKPPKRVRIMLLMRALVRYYSRRQD